MARKRVLITAMLLVAPLALGHDDPSQHHKPTGYEIIDGPFEIREDARIDTEVGLIRIKDLDIQERQSGHHATQSGATGNIHRGFVIRSNGVDTLKVVWDPKSTDDPLDYETEPIRYAEAYICDCGDSPTNCDNLRNNCSGSDSLGSGWTIFVGEVEIHVLEVIMEDDPPPPPPRPEPDYPDLVTRITASKTTLQPGEDFSVTADVQNIGGAAGTDTSLYYDLDGTQIGRDNVKGLSSGESIRLPPLTVKAPSEPDKYIYQACVQEVGGEKNAENNCSTVEITVSTTPSEPIIPPPTQPPKPEPEPDPPVESPTDVPEVEEPDEEVPDEEVPDEEVPDEVLLTTTGSWKYAIDTKGDEQ